MRNKTLKLVLFNLFLFLPLTSFSKEISIYEVGDLIFHSTPPLRSIEELVPLLPEKLKAQYVLMTDSLSLQEGTPENPRVVMFGRDADIFIAFNGGDGRGANTVEMIESVSGEYRFSEIVFDGVPADSDEAPYRSNQFAYEIRNPRKCTACHGAAEKARVNWAPYPVWPGASTLGFRPTGKEKKYLEQFISWGEGHPRYKHLNRRKNLDAVFDRSLTTTMASQMDEALRVNRRRRFIKNIRSIPQYEKYYFMILGALSKCENLEEFIPEDDLEKFEAKGSRQAAIDQVNAHVRAKAPQHYELFSFNQSNGVVAGSLKWIVESLGGNMHYWGTSIQSDYLYTTVPAVFYPPIVKALGQERSVKMPAMAIVGILHRPKTQKFYLNEERRSAHQTYCQTLQNKSLHYTETVFPSGIVQDIKNLFGKFFN